MNEETIPEDVMKRLEYLEQRVAELERRTWQLQPVGALTGPTVDFGTLKILEEQIEKARKAAP